MACVRHGHWAPSKADWGLDDRMRCVRVKSSVTPDDNCYMELRLPSAAACPYLIVAAAEPEAVPVPGSLASA